MESFWPYLLILCLTFECYAGYDQGPYKNKPPQVGRRQSVYLKKNKTHSDFQPKDISPRDLRQRHPRVQPRGQTQSVRYPGGKARVQPLLRPGPESQQNGRNYQWKQQNQFQERRLPPIQSFVHSSDQTQNPVDSKGDQWHSQSVNNQVVQSHSQSVNNQVVTSHSQSVNKQGSQLHSHPVKNQASLRQISSKDKQGGKLPIRSASKQKGSSQNSSVNKHKSQRQNNAVNKQGSPTQSPLVNNHKGQPQLSSLDKTNVFQKNSSIPFLRDNEEVAIPGSDLINDAYFGDDDNGTTPEPDFIQLLSEEGISDAAVIALMDKQNRVGPAAYPGWEEEKKAIQQHWKSIWWYRDRQWTEGNLVYNENNKYPIKIVCFIIGSLYQNAIQDLKEYYKIRYIYKHNVEYEVGYLVHEIVHRYTIILELYYSVEHRYYNQSQFTYLASSKYMLYMYTHILQQCQQVIHMTNSLNELERKYGVVDPDGKYPGSGGKNAGSGGKNAGSGGKYSALGSRYPDTVFQDYHLDGLGDRLHGFSKINTTMSDAMRKDELNRKMERKRRMRLLKKLRKKMEESGHFSSTKRTRRPKSYAHFPYHYGWSVEYW